MVEAWKGVILRCAGNRYNKKHWEVAEFCSIFQDLTNKTWSIIKKQRDREDSKHFGLND